MATAYLLNAIELYNLYFQKPYVVGKATAGGESTGYNIDARTAPRLQTVMGQDISYINAQGYEVFLPVILRSGNTSITIDIATIRITGKKTIISTPVAERQGTVKEQYTIGDWMITVKGVLQGKGGNFPDEEMLLIKELYQTTEPVYLDNALADLFLDTTNKVVIQSVEFFESEGKSLRHKAFTMQLESDFIDNLIFV